MSYLANQQYPIRTVHHSLDSFKKFDGRQANLETWFENAQTIASREGLSNNDIVLMSAARSLIDFNLPDNPAILVHDSQEARECKEWKKFKEMYRKGCRESSFEDTCDAIARFMEFKSEASQSEVRYLRELEHRGSQLQTLLERSPWNHALSGDARSRARVLARMLEFAVSLRELTPEVKMRVLAHGLSPGMSIVDYKDTILKAGGWFNQAQAVRTVPQGVTSTPSTREQSAAVVSKPSSAGAATTETVAVISKKKCKCFNCGKLGHIAKNCRAKKAKAESGASTADKSDETKQKHCVIHGKQTTHNTAECKLILGLKKGGKNKTEQTTDANQQTKKE